MSNLQSGASEAQMIDLFQNIKFPIMGAGGGFAPIGAEIKQFGITPPLGCLKCDGDIYNIADYPELATYYASQFGSVNYFGGDGTTTFAVPDYSENFPEDRIICVKATLSDANLDSYQIYSPNEHQVGWCQEYRTVEGQQVLMEKPVYIKTFTGISTSGTYSIDISSLSVDEPIELGGYCRVGESGNYIFGGNWNASVTESIQYFVQSDKAVLKLESGNTYIHGAYKLIFKYTKTTDQWQNV